MTAVPSLAFALVDHDTLLDPCQFTASQLPEGSAGHVPVYSMILVTGRLMFSRTVEVCRRIRY